MIEFDTDVAEYLPEQLEAVFPKLRVRGKLDPAPSKRRECQFCGDTAITRPLATVNPDTGAPQAVHACADCQEERTQQRIEQAQEQVAEQQRESGHMAGLTEEDARGEAGPRDQGTKETPTGTSIPDEVAEGLEGGDGTY